MILALGAVSLANSAISGPVKRQAKAVSVRFELDPPSATVWRRTVEGQVNYLGRSGEKVTIGLTPSEAAGERDLIVEFRVQLLFSEWVSAPEFLNLEKLGAERRFPGEGSHPLPLSPGQRWQAWLRAHPLQSLLLLALGTGLPLGWLRLRRKDEPEESKLRCGDYTLGEKLGEGAMGEVYLARSPGGRVCAVKLIRGVLSESSSFRQQFDRELATCVSLEHPNLLQLFGYGYASDGRTYLATELLQGDTLKARLEAGGGDGPLAAEVLEQVGSALDYLHSQSVVHQDVKPSNIFLCQDGTVKLLDLGVARRTGEGKVAGTPAYMAPEQFELESGPASDQYSLGLVVLEILQGKPEGQEPMIYAHLRSQEAPVRKGLSPELEAGMRRILDPSMEKRYPDLQSAREALSDLLLHHR